MKWPLKLADDESVKATTSATVATATNKKAIRLIGYLFLKQFSICCIGNAGMGRARLHRLGRKQAPLQTAEKL